MSTVAEEREKKKNKKRCYTEDFSLSLRQILKFIHEHWTWILRLSFLEVLLHLGTKCASNLTLGGPLIRKLYERLVWRLTITGLKDKWWRAFKMVTRASSEDWDVVESFMDITKNVRKIFWIIPKNFKRVACNKIHS